MLENGTIQDILRYSEVKNSDLFDVSADYVLHFKGPDNATASPAARRAAVLFIVIRLRSSLN